VADYRCDPNSLCIGVSVIFKSLEWIVQRRKLEEERRRGYVRIQDQAALLDKAQDAMSFMTRMEGAVLEQEC